MTPHELVAGILGWIVANWPTLLILGGLVSGVWRIGKLIERQEANNLLLEKLVRFHSLVHPNHSRVLFDPSLSAKDIDPDEIIACDAKPAKGR